MLAPLLRMALVLVTLVASAAWARPGPVAARVLKARQVVLREGPGESGELRVHPDYLTTLAFEADVAPGAVAVEDPGRVRVLGAQDGHGVATEDGCVPFVVVAVDHFE